MFILELIDRGGHVPPRLTNVVHLFHDKAPVLYDVLVKRPDIRPSLYMKASARISSTCQRRDINITQLMLMHQLAASLITRGYAETPPGLEPRNANFVRVIVETEIEHFRVHHPIRSRMARSAA